MIRELLSKITIDKYQHFAVAAIATLILRIILDLVLPFRTAVLIAATGVFLACVGKEVIYDKWMDKGECEWLDLIAGILGIIIATI